MAISFQTSQYNLIYVYQIDDDNHKGALKIGKASIDAYDVSDLTPNCDALNKAARERINDQTGTSATDYKLLYTEIAYFEDSKGNRIRFDDNAVHDVLEHSGYEKKEFKLSSGTIPQDWYKVDLETAIKAIAAIKNGQEVIDGPPIVEKPKKEINFRDEQKQAITDTIAHFKNGHRFLWNAKMRFGKTLCALEFIRQQNYGRVLILTHRPVVRSGWFEDYHKLPFKGWQYGSKKGDKFAFCKENDSKGKDFLTLEKDYTDKNKQIHYIYFASMQDLRGSKKVSDKGINKNDDVFKTNWDLIILDEAHEGTETALGKNVIKGLCDNRNPYLLYLSGTPFNILYHFSEEEIFTWDYVMEQEAKENWPINHPNEPNPYEGLAKLNICTYYIGDVFEASDYLRTEDDFFNFAEFFRVWTDNEKADGGPMPTPASKGKFVHEEHVAKFLDMLCEEGTDSRYPYSTEQFRQALSHTLWMLPGVDAALALEDLIKEHRLCKELGFKTINVAGEGSKIEGLDEDDFKKIEKIGNDALKKVQAAIKLLPRTITLSCGRLTTGVSVPEWTGVFMLRGGYNVDAGNYMQTIFRGQTPYKNGAIKTNCYAFDFAPDRTLTVVDEYIDKQPEPVGRKRSKAEKVASMLRLCPVIAMRGSQEVEYEARDFISEVNKAYRDHVLRNGFKGKMLHKSFADFTEADHALLAEIGKIFAGNKVDTTSDGKVRMSATGLTGDESGKKQKSKKKKIAAAPKPKTKAKEEEERRRKSQNVLDQIFVRLPLLLFGAVEDTSHLSIDELLKEDVIDQPSWDEFMPMGFTKPMLLQIKHLVKEDLLISCTAEIIKLAKKADLMPVEQRVVEIARMLSTFHYPDHETVLTPWRVVNMHMGDTIGGFNFYDESYKNSISEPRWIEHQDVTNRVFNKETHIFEINSKSGVYPLYIAYTLWRIRRDMTHPTSQDDERILWDIILHDNIFVLCKTAMAMKITKRVLIGYRDVETHCLVYPNLVEILTSKDTAKNKKKKEDLINKLKSTKYWNINNGNKDMRFNAIVSNPPYQIANENDNQNRQAPLYHKFVKLAKEIPTQYVSMITPARWYFKNILLGNFSQEFVSDTRISYLHDFTDASKIFPSVEIKSGVSYFLWDSDYNGICHIVENSLGGEIVSERFLKSEFDDGFIRYSRALPIIKKIKDHKEDSFSTIVSPQNPFGFNTKVKGSDKKTNDSIIIISKGRTDLQERYIDRKSVNLHSEWIDQIKILTPKAAEDGVLPGKVISKLHVIGKGKCCNGTYILIGPFADNTAKCNNVLKYISTRFFRFLVGVKKPTQDLKDQTFSLVPMQNFDSNDEIDWTKDIDNIDIQLYDKYGIEDPERDFINKLIKTFD